MLKIIILEFNKEMKLNEIIGEKDVSNLTVDEAHKEAKEFVKSLQSFKETDISYQIQQDGKILVYI